MGHPYLSFSRSTNYDGYVVGTSSSGTLGNGLLNKSVKIVQIPSSFNSIQVVEVGYRAFRGTGITSVFIPKTVKYLGYACFCNCESLSDVRFEPNSQLEKAGMDVFGVCYSLINIDLPASLKTLEYNKYFYLFDGMNSLEFCSYLGTTDFASAYIFKNSPTIRVSSSYPSDQFGRKTVTYKDGSTCGVSNEPFYEETKKATFFIRIKRVPQLLKIMILVLVS